ncbi:ribosome-inactivating family protein [Streptomyces sp. NPDC049541]|uniref:ribosome-inactivating family protein n=1 Tax=Streptomyces sp. NPDC049541 TaxID=3365594 RepID=UPI0037B954F8
MPTSVLIVVVLSVLLGILVFFTVPRDTGASASAAADQATINAETVADGKHVDFPQVRWNINRGSGAYLAMLDQLRNLAETSAGGRVAPDVGTEVNVAATGDTDSQSFADIVISSDHHTLAVHAIVRLSDFHIVRFFSSDTPHNSVLNLASEEGYEALARLANQWLTAVNLSECSLENSLWELGTHGTDRTAQARGMLRYLIAITEASRFHPIANRIANGMDNGSDVFVTAQEIGLIRN